MQEAKKIAEMKKREKMEERLARYYSELYNISRRCNGNHSCINPQTEGEGGDS